MKTVNLALRSFTSLLVRARSAAPPATTRCDSLLRRTGFHSCWTMATSSSSSIAETTPLLAHKRDKKPKETLRRTRIKEKLRRDVGGPSTVYLQVVGSGSRDSPAALYVFSEYNRYLFNCGEGTQRLMQEHKLKISHLDNIFLTRMSWKNVGGLSGMLLTLKDTGVPECALFGPPQLENYLKATKTFSGSMEEIKLSVRPYTDEIYADNTMTVYQVPIFAQSNSDGRKPSVGRSGPSQSSDSLNRDDGLDIPGEKQKSTQDAPLVVSFICKIQPKKGNFLVAQAMEFGLPLGKPAIGPLIAALKNGQTVTYEGREIRPEQVCTPADPGPVFIIVDCPSEEFVEAVFNNPQLRRYQTGGTEDSAALVVHITPESVLKMDQYKEWMKRFSSATEHLILNEQVDVVHNIRSHKIQAQLNMIHPEIFPQLKSYKTKEPPAALDVPSIRADSLLKFQLRPVMEWQRDAIPACNMEEFVKEASEVPNFLEEVDKCRQVWTDAADLSAKYPEVIFLGTGSSLPMKIRNVSGTLVNISPTQSVLLDCGEGTFGQLCRHYGDDVDEALSKISTVFISHLHADHHTGLIQFLYERERALTTLGKAFSPIHLIAPKSIMIWLNQYHNYCEKILKHINLVPNLHLCDNGEMPTERTISFVQALLKKNDLKMFQTCKVRHCKNAFACSFTHKSGWKLAFSGDTMPCDAFVRIGENATILIHEATLEDGMEEEALEKRHSTTSQAINVGMDMKAKFIMLNHFSQRYAKIPLFGDNFIDRVGISFDHMRIHFGDLKILPRLIPALQALFAQDIGEMEERREKRKFLKETFDTSSKQETSGMATVGQAAKRDQEEAETHDMETKRLKLI